MVITSHLPSWGDNYQILTKLSIKLNKAVQDVRDENKLHEYEKDKIIDLDRSLILKHLNSWTNIRDRLIFALYTLKPARRLDWRLTVLTTETDEKKLDNENINYISIPPKSNFFSIIIKLIFNSVNRYSN